MSRSWRIISLIVLIAILLGAVCVGVGLVTGGEWDRIYSSLDARYHIDMYVDYVGQVFTVLRDTWTGAAPTEEAAPGPAEMAEPTSAPAEEAVPAPDAAAVASPAPTEVPAA